MLQFRHVVFSLACALALVPSVYAGKLAIVIDDFGYRPHQENQVLALPSDISVAVLPNAPHAHEMATKAHNSGHEVLIHLPMAPLSKQPLEKDTLRPEMSSSEIERIIREAVNKVPYAVGLNNHMGSAMTSSLFGMQKVMQALDQYNFYFLDSMTIGNSQSMRAAAGTKVKVIKRKVFLDDTQNEADIRFQFNRAVALARRNGSAIAIGHPHPATVRVLQQMIYNLPPDITLVRPSSLLNEPQVDTSTPNNVTPGKAGKPAEQPRNPFSGVKLCKAKKPLDPVYATTYFAVLRDSISQSTLVKYMQHQWQGWEEIALPKNVNANAD
ncbi:divergent polysaccharide deacetylase family protein [Cedecea colo]|uniref:Divergent polysaccharide deacetylase family protein n=1 Tax=Cedecea colo TaxID=2552946 RepID=A0ABX0VUT2_9ENTR|nr:divergent polysaccharide deacetylase family protein [Cedecea colo]NIY49751.1 divergent polysaccharide deacetylase family protein [Cedecea colo]